MKNLFKCRSCKLLSEIMIFVMSVILLWQNIPEPNVSATTGNPRNSLVGAIRWDAWVGDLATAGIDVENTLGPNKYHFRLPFYGTETSSSTVTARATTQAVIDQEIEYASNAGIDYWAYCYYSNNSGLDLALDLHLSSSNTADVDWCYIFGRGSFADSNEVSTMITRMQLSNYVTVNGDHPLVYLFGDSNWTSTELDILRDAAEAADLPTLYITYMDFTSSSASSMCTTLGCQAISAYCMGGSDGQAFADGASDEAAAWDTYEATGKKVIPFVTTGWDPRPRIETENDFAAYYPNSWEQTATATEIADHLSDALQWSYNNQSTVEANAVLMYAWNEFDEGGWICPTLFNGTERLDAIRNMLDGSEDTTNKLINDGFENGTSSWSAQTCSIATISSNAKTGVNACHVTNRSYRWSTAIQDIKTLLTTNGQGYYTSSAWLKFTSGSDTALILIAINDSGGTHYLTSSAVTVGTSYTEIECNLNITWTGTLNSASIQVQTSSVLTDMYLDDISISKDPSNLLSNAGFESGTTSWAAQACSIATNASAHTGSNSCLASSRTAAWGTPIQNITNILTTNGEGRYSFGVWAKFSSGTDNVTVTVVTNDSNGTNYFFSRAVSIGTSYTQILDDVNIIWTGTLNSAYIEIGSTSSTSNIYLDDFYLAKVPPNLVSNPGFESGTSSWTAQDCSITADVSNVRNGSNACYVSNRTAVWGTPIQNITSVLTANGQGQYASSAWVKMTSGWDNVFIVVQTNDSSGDHWFCSSLSMVGTTYAMVAGNFNITWTGTLNSAYIEIQTGSTTSLYIDGFSLNLMPDNMLANPGFESGTTSWTAQSCSIATNASAHTGTYSCLASNRAYTWGSPLQDVKTILTDNGQGNYCFSVWSKLSTGTNAIYIIIVTNDSAGTHYFTSYPVDVTTSFLQIAYDINIKWTGTLNSAEIGIGTATSTANVYVDDFVFGKY
ncbi:MAG: carbohydrate binding domain-containing protein [Saccharofermentanales bacterium]